MNESLLWLDVETSGLEPEGGFLLQVAAIPTDLLGNETGEPFEAIVHYSEDEVAKVKESSIDFVQDMHTKTGLWERLPEGVPLEIVDATLAGIASQLGEPRQVQLAGNSVHFDYAWVKRHLPKLSAAVHYRLIDVTGIATTLVRFGAVEGRYPGDFEGDKHNAVDDIRHAVKEYRWIKDQVAPEN